MNVKGFAHSEVEQIWHRAFEVCEMLGADEHYFLISWNLWLYHHVAGNLKQASGWSAALKALTDQDGLAASDLMAWIGFEADEAEPPAQGTPTGFQRSVDAVERIRWLRDHLEAWARRTRASKGSKGGRPDLFGARLEAVA